ncbi:two component system response regulator [Marinactinospora endophytica]
MPAVVRVVLADDEAMFRAGIRAILSADPEVEVVAEAVNGRELVEAARSHRPDVALVDIQMPRLDGLAAVPQVRAHSPGTAVVMLTTFGRDEYIARALQEGASGFLLKAGDPRELIAAVRATAEGGAYLSPVVARRVITEFRGRGPARGAALDRVGGLSPRERETLALLGTGMSNAEIARRLFVSEETVKSHVKAVLAGLGVRNRVQAAIVAHEAGLVGDVPD